MASAVHRAQTLASAEVSTRQGQLCHSIAVPAQVAAGDSEYDYRTRIVWRWPQVLGTARSGGLHLPSRPRTALGLPPRCQPPFPAEADVRLARERICQFVVLPVVPRARRRPHRRRGECCHSRSIRFPYSPPGMSIRTTERSHVSQPSNWAAQTSRWMRRSSSPLDEWTSSTRGIAPTAWVEQLRHGSKARIPASNRFKVPSATSGPRM